MANGEYMVNKLYEQGYMLNKRNNTYNAIYGISEIEL